MDAANLGHRFEQLISQRAKLLPEVDRQLQALEEGREALRSLQEVIDETKASQVLPPDLVDELGTFDADRLSANFEQAIGPLRQFRSRLSRATVNIGVGGPARVGKSTLLQSVSGLGDDQIPASDRGTPVTAVRSRIFHSAHNSEVRLTMHTFDTFREDVLRPFHQRLGLHNVPTEASELAVFGYPSSIDEIHGLDKSEGAVRAFSSC